MLKYIFKNYIYPVAVMAGSIVGVGFLSLPYITMKVGVGVMALYFIVLTALIVYVHVIFAKISLKTPDYKRFPGFVGFYLGNGLKKVALGLTVLGSFGVLLIYLVVANQFLIAIFGGAGITYALIFFVAVSAVLYFEINAIAKIEFWALSLLAILFALIFASGAGNIKLDNLFVSDFGFRASDFFLPYGAILFALWGTGLIPEIEEMCRGHKKSFIKVVVIATLLPAVLYTLFIIFVLGITGPQTTESALAGLKLFLHSGVITVGLGMGVVAIFMAFISQGLILKKTLMYDTGMKEWLAWGFTCAVPLLFFLMGFNSFISLISFLGGAFVGVSGILILLMYKKIGGKPIIVYPLIIFFMLGIIYELTSFLK